MPKIKTYPWDPADVIETGEDAILYLRISLEDYDPSVFDALMNDIARSKGVAEIAGVEFSAIYDGHRSVTITTTGGTEATIAIAPDVSVDSIRQALSSRSASEPVSA